uniref:YqcC family protein n=1 Tax=Klebsiella sp. TaxID=576 RepID=UPI002584B31E|nr:YqcC family protein [Klebsiella sp.]
MTLHHRVRERLHAIEALLRETEHWQENAPESRAFASDQPFCLDTMEPLEWLQWVLIPRMHQLLENEMPLPQNFAVASYYEMALDNAHPVREQVLAELVLLDTLFAGGEV